MKRDGVWFQPDNDAIEAIVQDHIPSPEIKVFVDNAIKSISDFLVKNTPQDIRSCEICVGDITHEISCINKNDVVDADEDDETYNLEDDPDLGCYSFFPMRGIVVKTPTGYTIKTYGLTKIALKFVTNL